MTLSNLLKGRNLAALARECGCGRSMMSQIATGRKVPSLQLVVRIASATNSTIDHHHLFSTGQYRFTQNKPAGKRGAE